MLAWVVFLAFLSISFLIYWDKTASGSLSFFFSQSMKQMNERRVYVCASDHEEKEKVLAVSIEMSKMLNSSG